MATTTAATTKIVVILIADLVADDTIVYIGNDTAMATAVADAMTMALAQSIR